jgi:hypothetical protein
MVNYYAIHCRRVTIYPEDMRLVDTLRQLMGGPSYNETARLNIVMQKAMYANQGHTDNQLPQAYNLKMPTNRNVTATDFGLYAYRARAAGYFEGRGGRVSRSHVYHFKNSY